MRSSQTSADAPCLTARMSRDTEWSVLSPEEIKLFNDNVVRKTYKMGEIIFYEDDECKGLYLVESGLIGVRKVDLEGRDVLIRLAHPGDTLGYRPLLAGENHRAGAEIIQPAAVCFLPKAIMQRLLIANPALGTGFLKRTAKALGAADERFFETITLPARVRLFHLLMIMREHYGRTVDDGSLFLELQLTRGDIASMLGIRAESLSRLIRKIESENLAHFSGNKITITNPDSLIKELDADLHTL